MERITTPKAPAAIGPYSQAYRTGDLLFTSGQVALDPETGEIVGSTIEEQARRCCESVGAILAEAGLGFENVVKTTCFLSTASTSPASPPAPAWRCGSCRRSSYARSRSSRNIAERFRGNLSARISPVPDIRWMYGTMA